MANYNSLEDFIHKNNRYPNTDETRRLYSLLWKKYLFNLDKNEKNIAIKNNSISQQNKKIKIMQSSLKDLQKSLKQINKIVAVGIGERWGDYHYYVELDCDKKNLYKFRKKIPNFFYGFEVKIFSANLIKRLLYKFKNYKINRVS